MARSMFTHAEILMGKNNHRGQTCTYRIFRWPGSSSIFCLAGEAVSYFERGVSLESAGPRLDCFHASAMKPAPFKYIAATSLEHALVLQAAHAHAAKIL